MNMPTSYYSIAIPTETWSYAVPKLACYPHIIDYRYNELQKTISLLSNSLPFSNFAISSRFPIAFEALASCLTNSSSLLSDRIVDPSNCPVSFWTSTNFAPLTHAYTASILSRMTMERKTRSRQESRQSGIIRKWVTGTTTRGKDYLQSGVEFLNELVLIQFDLARYDHLGNGPRQLDEFVIRTGEVRLQPLGRVVLVLAPLVEDQTGQ